MRGKLKSSRFGESSRRLHAVLLVVVIGLLTLAVFPSFASAVGCDSWNGGTGNWSDASDWSGGVPTSSSNVCIDASSASAVTLGGGTINTVTVASLTLGAGSGAPQTLLVQGEPVPGGGSVYNGSISITGTSSIGSTGELQLDSASGSGPDGSAGSALLGGTGTLTNNGTILTTVEPASVYDSSSYDTITTPVVNGSGGTIEDQTGELVFEYVTSLTNDGTLKVDAGTGAEPGSLVFHGTSDGPIAVVNNGSVQDGGSIALNNASTWTQNGPETGGTVNINTGGLTDESGSGSFELVDTVNASGTIPAGQSVTVQASSGQDSAMVLSSALTNNGKLVLAAAGGFAATLMGGSVTNNGNITTSEDTSVYDADDVTLRSPLTNAHAGVIDITSGTLIQDEGTASTNDGTISISPGATYELAGGLPSTLTNAADGTLEFGISSASTFGAVKLTSGGAFTAGGTTEPVLSGGYVPASGTAFMVVNGGDSGKFASVLNGFSGDYSSPSSISLVYGGAAGGTSSPASPSVGATSVKGSTATTVVSCTGSGSCTVKLTLEVNETVVHGKVTAIAAAGHAKAKHRIVIVGSKTVTVQGGQSAKVGVPLNAKGLALLARHHHLAAKLLVTTSAAGKTVVIATRTVVFSTTKKKKR